MVGIMEKAKIERINALARKSKEEGLSAEEKIEQAKLRAEYLKGIRRSLKSQLDNIEFVDEK